MPVITCDVCCIGKSLQGRCDFCGSPMPASAAFAAPSLGPPITGSFAAPPITGSFPAPLPRAGSGSARPTTGTDPRFVLSTADLPPPPPPAPRPSTGDLFAVGPAPKAGDRGPGKRCPSCAVELPDPVPRRCPNCETSLSKADATTVCPACGKKNPIRESKCSQCGWMT